MVIGITGISGYIGNYLSRYLLDKGYTIYGLTRSSSLPGDLKDSGISTIIGDLCSLDCCADFVSKVDVIIHLAHTSTPLSADANLSEEFSENVLPSLNLIQTIQSSGKSIKLIYPSSGGTVYGRSTNRKPFCEDDVCRPECAYGIQKYTIENYIRYYSGIGSFDSFILRISNPYGLIPSSDRKQGLIGVVLNRVKDGKPIQIFGDSRNVRDYIHLEDLCDLINRCIYKEGRGSIYNIGSGVGISVEKVLSFMESCIQSKFVRETIVNDQTQKLIDWSVLDITKVRQELGWAPHIDFDVGVRELCKSHFRM